MIATVLRFDVQAVDGEGIPVPSLEVGARFTYPSAPSTWSLAETDGDGWAHFEDEHREPPVQACLFVGDRPCDTFDIDDGARLTLEL